MLAGYGRFQEVRDECFFQDIDPKDRPLIAQVGHSLRPSVV